MAIQIILYKQYFKGQESHNLRRKTEKNQSYLRVKTKHYYSVFRRLSREIVCRRDQKKGELHHNRQIQLQLYSSYFIQDPAQNQKLNVDLDEIQHFISQHMIILRASLEYVPILEGNSNVLLIQRLSRYSNIYRLYMQANWDKNCDIDIDGLSYHNLDEYFPTNNFLDHMIVICIFDFIYDKSLIIIDYNYYSNNYNYIIIFS
ncbi:unnamed protein product [Paramecium octaurelia]|uniref:Uncharacterized protein n=1 Tax=Paramecium octaurelia TaxID=43137 RepID=A0A8S1XX59_PAROT|nr:unnamed protein product [Paramecium octaurelia]